MDGGGLEAGEEAFDALLESRTAPEAPICDEALAAAECLAALSGKVVADTPTEIIAWASKEERRPTAALAQKARLCIDRILAESELKDLWEESDDAEKWKSEVLGLVQRIPSPDSLPQGQPRSKPWWKRW